MTKRDLRVTMGKMIRAERLKRNMSLEEVAKLLNLTTGFVGLIERGERGVTIYNLYSLAVIFDISMDVFFFNADGDTEETSELAQKHLKISSLVRVMDSIELDYCIDHIKSVKAFSDAVKAQKQSPIPSLT